MRKARDKVIEVSDEEKQSTTTKHLILPIYIKDCLKQFGNTVVSSSVVKKLTPDGVRVEVLKQFQLITTLKKTENDTWLLELDKRYHGGGNEQ